jgi:PII-like signaling protein
MKGFQITFFTQQDRKYKGKPLAEWLLQAAKDHGALGGTITAGSESFGRDGHFHSAHFFELADQPIVVTMAVDEATAKSLFEDIEKEGVSVFYVKTAVEFGAIGKP